MSSYPLIPRPQHFDDRGVNIEKFIKRLCKCPTLKKLGVRISTGKKLITGGRGKWGTEMAPSLRRAWKDPTKAVGSGYYRGSHGRYNAKMPGRMNLTIGGSAHPASVVELILHEFMHCIGYDHSQEMDDLIVFTAMDLWGVNLHKVTGKRFFKGVYAVDWALKAWMVENWNEISKNPATCYRYDEPMPEPSMPNVQGKKSRVMVGDDGKKITIKVTRSMYDCISSAIWSVAESPEAKYHEIALSLVSDCETCVEQMKYKNRAITLGCEEWDWLRNEVQDQRWSQLYDDMSGYQNAGRLLKLIHSGTNALYTGIAHKAMQSAGIEMEPTP